MRALTRRRAPSATSDGRVQRGERSREAIVAALLALVGAGELQPTAQQVAERAGVGLRSVFRHFSDMESLYAEMDARLSAEVRPMRGGGSPSGALRTRARELVRRRAQIFEKIGPFKRAANVNRWRSPFLRGRHAILVRELRSDLLLWLPELRDAPGELADALDLVLSFEAWDRLRSDQRLSRERAEQTLARGVAALLKEIE